jgi:hypothetical protein
MSQIEQLTDMQAVAEEKEAAHLHTPILFSL